MKIKELLPLKVYPITLPAAIFMHSSLVLSLFPANTLFIKGLMTKTKI